MPDTQNSPAQNRVLVLGYSDGPTDGILQFADGRNFRFQMTHDTPEGRGFELSPLPPDALERHVALLEPHHVPRWPIWVPLWRFVSPALQRDIEAASDALLVETGHATSVVMVTNTETLATLRAPPPDAGVIFSALTLALPTTCGDGSR